MTPGIYRAAAAMASHLMKQDVLANNLANVDSAGFKADRISFAFRDVLLPKVAALAGNLPATPSSSTIAGQSRTDFSAGGLRETGNPLDVALPDGEFLTVRTPAGDRYTRHGRLRLSQEGKLETADGFKVMGKGGEIQIAGREVHLTERAEVVVNGAIVDRLALARFADLQALRKEGNGLFSGPQAQPATASGLRTGYLEGSNVNPVRTMVEMITTLRAYEAAQRTVQLQDETIGKAMEVVQA